MSQLDSQITPKESLVNLVSDCKIFNAQRLEPIKTNISSEFVELKDSINQMIASILNHQNDIVNCQSELMHLNNEVTFQNQKLSDQLTKITKIERQKEEFTSMMTHEFKTPLTPILSWSDLLLTNVLGDVTDKQAKAAKKINSNAMQLLGLISDVLDAQKLDLSEMPFNKEQTSTKEIVTDLIENYEPIMKENNIKLIFSEIENISLNTDKNRIEQVLRIFITNAMDFVPANDGKIQIKVEEQNNRAYFGVKDNGVGISKENQDKLFHKFYQADSSVTRKHGGSGLGLAISKGIAEALKGEVGVKSDTNKGSEFFIKIPKE